MVFTITIGVQLGAYNRCLVEGGGEQKFVLEHFFLQKSKDYSLQNTTFYFFNNCWKIATMKFNILYLLFKRTEQGFKNVGYMIPNKMVADLISLYLQKKWFSRFNVEWINLTKVSACQNKRLFFIWWNYNESSNFVYLISSMLACYVISDYKKFSFLRLFT